MDEFAIRTVAALGEPVRRELYNYVVAQRDPVSREQAAAGVDVPHHVAKFHLDRLEQDGLLETSYARPEGRSGPGAGRPSKLYRRSDQDIAVSLPPREYDLAGRVLAQAIARANDGVPLATALRTAASDTGRTLATGSDGDAADVLAAHGYEPYSTDTGIALANCPFHSLAEEFTELVCRLNLDLVRGVLRETGGGLRARLDPGPDRCCVTLSRVAPRG